jgi:type IX secretion system PorP/SprF family membrane protein
VDYRICADYRSQWKSISGNPYSTTYLSFDMPKKRFGIGGYFINNHVGSGGYNSFNFMLSGAYQITDHLTGPHFLSVGLQAGIMNKGFNPENFTYDSQYSGSSPTGFDENLSSNEVFTKTNVLKFDANMGVFYKYKQKFTSVHPFIGLSVFHVTMPDESFSDEEKRLPVRFSLHGGTDFMINKGFKLTPRFLLMTQDKATEINAGILGYYNIRDTKYDVILGLDYRVKDAVILQFGIKQDGHHFRISYDVNTSYLNKFSGNRGGIEFSLIFSGRKKEKLFQF